MILVDELLGKLRKKKPPVEDNPWVTAQPQPAAVVNEWAAPKEAAAAPPEAPVWGVKPKTSFKPMVWVATLYVLANVVAAVMVLSNNLLVTGLALLYLIPNTLILLHYVLVMRK